MKACVLGTDVLLAAFRSDAGASRWLLDAARVRRFKLLLSIGAVDVGIRISSYAAGAFGRLRSNHRSSVCGSRRIGFGVRKS